MSYTHTNRPELPAIATMPVARAFFSNAVPAIVNMVLTTSIIMVDGFFIGRYVGPEGLAAVNLTVPVLYLFLGFAVMTGVGGSTLAGHRLGAGDPDDAARIFSATIVFLAAGAALLALGLAFFLDPVLFLLKADGALLPLAGGYLGRMLWFYAFSMGNIGLMIFFRGEGKAGWALLFSLLGNVVNVVLDWLFLAVLGMGTEGAATASGLAALVATGGALAYVLSGRSVFSFVRPRFHPGELPSMLGNGSSEMISQLSGAIVLWLFNALLLEHLGASGVAAFAVIGYLVLLETMVLTGFAIGLGPLVAIAKGAGDGARILASWRIARRAGFVVGVAGWAFASFASGAFAGLLVPDRPEIAELVSQGARILSLGFLMNGYTMLASALFTALGAARESALVSFLRSLGLLGAALLLLPRLFGTAGIWMSVPFAEAGSLAVALPLVLRLQKAFKTNSQYQSEPRA